MNVRVHADGEWAAREAASIIAGEAREAAAVRGRFMMAVSGGRTPWMMLRALAGEDVPWESVYLFQVDERAAPAGHADRNLTQIQETLLVSVPVPPAQVFPMPVESSDLEASAWGYAQTLQRIAGAPAVLDLVHLGLGPDGHTASLAPGDPCLDVVDQDVTVTGVYQGRRRMTLTYPILNRARRILWLVTGADKAAALERLLNRDLSIPAGRVRRDGATIVADRAAAALSENLIL